MARSDENTRKSRDPPAVPARQVPRLNWTLEQAAGRLGVSPRTFYELRALHPLYLPDGSRTIVENPRKDMPLWSEDLLQLVAFARSISIQGVRQLSDDEALQVRIGMESEKRRRYLQYIDE